MIEGLIGIAQVTDVMRTFGVMLGRAVILALIVIWLCSMMAWVFALFQATVAGMIAHLRPFWAEDGELLVIPNPEQPVVAPNPEQQFVIPEDDPINPHSRAEVRYQSELPPLDYWSDSSDNDN